MNHRVQSSYDFGNITWIKWRFVFCLTYNTDWTKLQMKRQLLIFPSFCPASLLDKHDLVWQIKYSFSFARVLNLWQCHLFFWTSHLLSIWLLCLLYCSHIGHEEMQKWSPDSKWSYVSLMQSRYFIIKLTSSSSVSIGTSIWDSNSDVHGTIPSVPPFIFLLVPVETTDSFLTKYFYSSTMSSRRSLFAVMWTTTKPP